MKKIFASILLCLVTVMAWADGNPFIKSLSGSISGNTLTLTAIMNYDNVGNQIRGSLKFHWIKDGVEQQGQNNVFTDNNAFTPTDITWKVYATYTYQEVDRQTDTVTYVQKKPEVSVEGSVSGFDLVLTPTLNTLGVEVSNVHYFLLPQMSDELSGTAFNPSVEKFDAINFEGKAWFVYATYEYNSQSYRSTCGMYYQDASSLPTLSVTKVENSVDNQLEMTANLSKEYEGKITNIQYHWSKDGGEAESNKTNVQNSPHSFATQNWSCYASFEYNSQTYTTNAETYIYYSTLGHITIKITDDGTNLSAALYKADAEDNPTGEKLILPDGVNVSYEWTDSKTIKYANKTAIQPKPDNGAIWIECKATLTDDNDDVLEKYEVYRLNSEAKVVVFVNYTGGGNDSNSGLDYRKPVATWKKAYSLLPHSGSWDNNIIVVVNNGNTTKPAQINDEDTDNKAATITGEWPWEGTKDVTGGRFYLGSDGYIKNGLNSDSYIGAPTKFKNISMYCINGSQARLCLLLHDTYFDEGVVMQNFSDLNGNMGETVGRKAPNFHMMLYTDRADTRGFNQTKPMSLTIKSGRYGRVMCTRIQGTTENEIAQRYVVGRPENPFKAVVNIDIPATNPQGKKSDGSMVSYTDDIAFLCAGTTQGIVYGDVIFNIKKAKIATLTGGSQGNAITQVVKYGLPVSTYFGRTIVNIDCVSNDNVNINKFYATSLGRNCGGSGICDAFFYGHTIFNMNGGTINGGVYSTAGGILGLQAAGYHTPDNRIPYAKLSSEPNGKTVREGVSYTTYNESRHLPLFNSYKINNDSAFSNEPEILDFQNESKVVYNISGGLVRGGIYGGGQGSFLPDMPAANAPAGAGSIYANTDVVLSGSPIIDGSIYGGGAGATDYYNGVTSPTDKNKFTNVATVYGNTNVTITGTPDIHGNIYGGGAGVEATSYQSFLDIAKVYGNTNILFNADFTDDNPFRGNIYGGGALGGVEGNTNVLIKKGTILGNVFGGSQGQEGFSNKAKVVGTTKVIVGD